MDFFRSVVLYFCLAELSVLLCIGAEESSSTFIASGANDFKNIKNPTKWFEWGFDFRFRHEYHNNAYTLSDAKPNHECNYQRYRGRLAMSFLASEDLSLNTRLIWEGREYFKPDSKSGMDWDEGVFDNFNLKLGDEKNRPLTLVLGRQEIAFGNHWLIFDPTTTDGSRTEFFDAARLIWNVPDIKTKFNFVYYDLAADSERWLHPINSRNKPLCEEDQRGAFLYLENKSIKNAQIDGYFIFKHGHKVLQNGNDSDLFISGSRQVLKLSEHWESESEFAIQAGSKNHVSLLAFGLNAKIEYLFKDSLKNRLRLGYEYLSGDDPNTKKVEGWDPLWGRRAIWSELLVFTFSAENNGRSGEWSNLQRVDIGWSFSPIKNTEFSADYMPLFANQNTYKYKIGYSDSGKFRGHFLSAIFKFKLSKNIDGHLWSEFFFPGDYYSPDRRDMATFFRTQLVYKF
ncbi:MAG: alginate export family protein [Limisphaerales bacterium]|jgi:hypothetical protein